jgi:FixJ family two-component response regulator
MIDWHERGILAVICEQSLPDGTWRDVSAHIGDGSGWPPVIVASSLANAPLWADVLNFGGSDLIAKPFREWEVLWALDAARTRKNRPALSPVSQG